MSADVADNEVGVRAVGAHHCDFAVAKHTVVVHLIAEVLTAVEDVDEVLVVNVGIKDALRSYTAAHAEVEWHVLSAFWEVGWINKLVSLDVATIVGVVECRSFYVGTHLHVDVRVGKTTVFTVDVEVGLHFNLL